MRTFLAIACLALLTVAFAGCAEDPERYPNGVPSSTRTSSGTGSATSTGTGSATSSSTGPVGNGTGNGTDQPPTATVQASTTNGTAPLNVTFRMSGTDPEGGNLTWTLDLGDGESANGTELPAELTHTYEAVGNYSVVFTVSDGLHNTTANGTIRANASEPGAPPEDDWAVFNFDGTCDAKGEVAAGPGYVHERGDPPGTGFLLGSGTWVYEESNGLEGLQVGGTAEDVAYQGCTNPDTLLF